MTTLRDRIGRLQSRLQPGAGGFAGGFFAWWARSLAAWLPPRWRASLGLGRDRLLLSSAGDALQLRLEQDDGVVGPVLEDVAVLPPLAGWTDAGDPLQPVLAPAQRRQRADPARAWNLALATIAILAFGLALWQVLVNRRAATEAFQQSVDARAGEARQASVQRQRLVDAVAGQTFLDQARAGRPSAIEIIDELSRRLPDHTYLEKLAIENDKLLLIGLSSDASSLIGRLEGSKLWRAAALAGAVQPDPRTRRDRFTLTADLIVNAPTAPAREAADARAAR